MWDSQWQVTWGSHFTEFGNLSLYLFWQQFYWEGSSGPGQGFSSESEIGELILQDHQQIRHLSLNLCGSQEVSKEPYKFCVPLWSCGEWSNLSFRLIKNFVLNQSSFSQSFIKSNIFLPKASLSKHEHVPETSMRTFFSELPPIPYVECISLPYSHEREAKRLVSHFVGWLASSCRLLCDPLGGNGQELVSSPHITRSETLNVLVP